MTISKKELEAGIEAGYSLKELAEMEGVHPSYLSKLCKKYGITAPPPGHKKGERLSEFHKERIREGVLNK